MLDILWSVLAVVVGFRWLLFNALLCILGYQWIWKTWSYFSRNGVKYIRGIPILGSQWRLFVFGEHFNKTSQAIYYRYPDEKIVGFYDFCGSPNYMICTPDLIKQIAIKDFDHFVNHKFSIDHEVDPLFGRSLFMMRDQRWKNMRSTMSPAFTGSKMRLMFSLMRNVSHTFCDNLKLELTDGGKTVDCNIQEFFCRYSSDVIASCAFGMNINSMTDKDNEFYKVGVSASQFAGFKSFLKIILLNSFPKVAKLLNIPFINSKDTEYFRQIVKTNMEYREKNGIVRNDMINMMMQVKKGTLTSGEEDEPEGDIGFATAQEAQLDKTAKINDWTDDDINAQCMSFLLGGFSTVTLTLSFIAHDIAVRPDVQNKLLQEIQQTTESLNGEPLTYETLQKMKYLDMVVSESMRLWPQAPQNDRIVTKPYNLDIGDGRIVPLNVGDTVTFPVQAVHRNPLYFPNPDEFIPERFNDANKGNIVTGSYMPFGIGPRNCIASRFALMECKACIFHLLSNYKLEPCAKTQHPLQLKRNTAAVEAEQGFWMRITLRE